MMLYSKKFDVRWADVDANAHMRHTAYGDYAAHVRFAFLAENSFSSKEFHRYALGPAALLEELYYLKEVHLGETIQIDFQLKGISADRKYWRVRHLVYKEPSILVAQIFLSLGWMDLKQRKLVILEPEHPLVSILNRLQKTNDFSEFVLQKPPPV